MIYLQQDRERNCSYVERFNKLIEWLASLQNRMKKNDEACLKNYKMYWLFMTFVFIFLLLRMDPCLSEKIPF